MISRLKAKRLTLLLDDSSCGTLNDSSEQNYEPESSMSSQWTLTAATHESPFLLSVRTSVSSGGHDLYDLDSFPFIKPSYTPGHVRTSFIINESPTMPASAHPPSHPTIVFKFQRRKRAKTIGNVEPELESNAKVGGNIAIDNLARDNDSEFDQRMVSQLSVSHPVMGRTLVHRALRSTTEMSSGGEQEKWKSVRPLPPLPSSHVQTGFFNIFSSPTGVTMNEAVSALGSAQGGTTRRSEDGNSISSSGTKQNGSPLRKKRRRALTGPRSPTRRRKPIKRRSPVVASWDRHHPSPTLRAPNVSHLSPIQDTFTQSTLRGRETPFPVPKEAPPSFITQSRSRSVSLGAALQVALKTKGCRNGVVFSKGSYHERHGHFT